MLTSAAVQAEERRVVQLEYERGAGTDACIDKAGLQRAVAARIGYFPFSTGATTTLRVELRQEGRRFASSMVMVDDEGQPIGTRELSLPGEDCEAMGDALALALAIAIDPGLLTRPPPSDALLDLPPLPPEALVRAADAPATSSPAAPPRVDVAGPARDAALPPPPSPGLSFGLSAVLAPGLGATPGPSLGLVLGGHVSLGFFSLGLEATTTAALALRLPDGGEIQGDVQHLGLAPCLRVGWAAACGLVHGGVLRLSSQGFAEDHTAFPPYLAAGGRLGLDVPLRLGSLGDEGVSRLLAPFALRLQADVATPLLIVKVLDAQERPYWASPPVLGALGAGIVAQFP